MYMVRMLQKNETDDEDVGRQFLDPLYIECKIIFTTILPILCDK